MLNERDMRNHDKLEDEMADFEGLRTTIDPLDFIKVVDVESDLNYVVRKDTCEVVSFHPKVWDKLVPKATKEIIGVKPVKFKYNPFELGAIVNVDWLGASIKELNSYIPPKWRKKQKPETVECPKKIDMFMRHLFPHDESREFVYSWIYNALMFRCETYLVLNGAKGTGKGVFCEILKMVMGKEHYTLAPDGSLDSQFNSFIHQMRLVVFDEFTIDKKGHTRLKRFANNLQNIELKGVDARKAEKIYCSYVVSNNGRSDTYLESDDRRFSVPEITDVPLKDVMTLDEIEQFANEIESDEDLAIVFGNFLLDNYGNKYKPHSVFKSDSFFNIVESSLREWQKYISQELSKGEALSVVKLRKDYRRIAKGTSSSFPTSNDKINDFLINYRYRGDFLIGKLEDGFIYPTEEFLKLHEGFDELL